MHAWPLNDTASTVFPLTSRANVGEIFPDPITPLNASTGFFANLEKGWSDAYVATGAWDHDLYDQAIEHNPICMFGSYIYINMSLMRLFGVRVPGFTPEAVDLQYFGDMPGIPSYESEKRDFDEDPAASEKAGAWLVGEVLGATDLAPFDADRARILDIRRSRPDLSTLSDAELAARITSFNDDQRHFFCNHIVASLAAGVGLGAVAQVCAAIGTPELSLTLVAGIGDVDSAGASKGIWSLSRKVRVSAELTAAFDAGTDGLMGRLQSIDSADGKAFRVELDAFLDEWDFRGQSEWELRAATWGSDPELALSMVERLRLVGDSEAPEAKGALRAAEREAATVGIREALAGSPEGREALPQFEAALHAGAHWVRARERQRTSAAMLIHELRLAAIELGRRGVAAGALPDAKRIFMLFADELPAYVANPAPFGDTLAERERVYLDLFDYIPPFVVAGQAAEYTEWERRDAHTAPLLSAGEVLTGVSGCPGVARGRARVVLHPDAADEFEPGDVLVAPITDPSWTPLFVGASAVVVNVGAPFSHAAIVSRELGIPCVVSAIDATVRIPDGALLEVDGTTGAVTVLEI
ncbi:PEP-utilizing enzyme [Sporichthya sp.]|uniref:PEP-utilizing enzyme n=1 Tax=Sporichthya sp. TaxID=65475 RepID=UPI0018322B7F|nr:PEP-utilizing enzyme [Sporichthya sp.]MBA3743886.1 phosphoenolpyruvate-utilizing protein [Sporichthya sp.]